MDHAIVEAIAMQAVMERGSPWATARATLARKLGYDVEAWTPTGRLPYRGQGRRADADTITVTRNEI